MKRVRTWQKFCKDTHGFSTTIDVFLFLAMVSVSAVILLPAITGNTQIISALESKSQKHTSQTLLTLLNARVDDFGYAVAGDRMDSAAGPFNQSSVYLFAKKLIAGHELKHRTFADLAAENAAAQWVVYHNGKRIQFNFLMSNYTNSLDNVMKDYLDRQIGDRYSYNLTVSWRPFVNVPIGGDVRIGEPTPDNAYAESTYITMPYHVNFTRKRVEDIFDSAFNETILRNFTMLKKSGNRAKIEKNIANDINGLINRTIDDAVAELVNASLEPVLDRGQSTMIGQVNDVLPESDVLINKDINDIINTTLQEENAHIEGNLSSKFISYLRDVTKQEIHARADDEIKILVTDLADMYVSNAITIDEIKDRILTEVFARIGISRAQVTLAIWEKRV